MNTRIYRILIIEDDITISSVIKNSLAKWGYESSIVDDFLDILEAFSKYSPHLVLLDINLPYYDGFYWCSKIREISNIPIIFISSRTDDNDKIRGITGGGDDYIEKPFSMDLLVTKIQAMLRRSYSYIDTDYTTLSFNGLTLDIEKSVIFINGDRINLSNNECQIMSLLIRASGRIVTRSKIIKSLWDSENFIDDNTLTVNINRLRNRLKTSIDKDVIITVKGKGYRLNED